MMDYALRITGLRIKESQRFRVRSLVGAKPFEIIIVSKTIRHIFLLVFFLGLRVTTSDHQSTRDTFKVKSYRTLVYL